MVRTRHRHRRSRRPPLPVAIAAVLLGTVVGSLSVVMFPYLPRATRALGLGPSDGHAATFLEIRNFGDNPTHLQMELYRPSTVPTNPAIVLAAPECGSTGRQFYARTEFATLAENYGFYVIYPSATRPGGCFDASSPAALSPGGGGDQAGILSMISYVERREGADAGRVFIVGVSSGAELTAALLGDHPDVFRAGAVFAGVPFGCATGTTAPGGTSPSPTPTGPAAAAAAAAAGSACPAIDGQARTPAQMPGPTPAAWGDLVRAANPNYRGPRPRVQLWQLDPDAQPPSPSLDEEIAQWTDVLGVGHVPALSDTPRPQWAHTRYGDTGPTPPVEAYRVQGSGPALPQPGMAADVIRFFGLDTQPAIGSRRQAAPPPSPGSRTPSALALPGGLSHRTPSAAAGSGPTTEPEPTGAPGAGGSGNGRPGGTPGTSGPGTPPTSTPPAGTPPVSTSPPGRPTPLPSTPSTSPPPSTPVGAAVACQVRDAVSSWQGGLTATITLTNVGTTSIDGWSLTFTLPSGQTITNAWNASYSGKSGPIVARNAGFNARLAPNKKVTLGFVANRTGAAATPTSFALNGQPCSGG